MQARCYNENEEKYPRYGGRGVYICDRWLNDFASFLADMGPRPSSTHSIDRRDNDGSYTCGKCPQCVERGAPANCRWATPKEQARNQSRNRLLTFDGKTQPTTDWALSLGWKPSFLLGRLDRGWTVEQALTTPPLGFGWGNRLQQAVADGRAAAATPSDTRSLPMKQQNPNPRKPRNPPPSLRINLATARPLRCHAEALAA